MAEPATVKSGRYRGFTLEEVREAEKQYKEAVKQRDAMQVAAGGGLVSGGDAGGSNVNFAHTAASLEEWRAELDSALAEFDEDAEIYATDKFQASFR